MLRKAMTRGFAPPVLMLVYWTVLSAAWLAAQQQPVDLIFHNGKVLTVDDQFPVAQAVAVAGNRITAVGSNADVLKLAGPNTRVMDLKGRTAFPV